jgi:hypothetical protein
MKIIQKPFTKLLNNPNQNIQILDEITKKKNLISNSKNNQNTTNKKMTM